MKKTSSPIELNFGELPTLPFGWRWGQMANVATDERNSIVDGPFGSNLKLNDYIDPPGVPVLTTANLRGDYGPSSVRYISQSKFNQLKRSEVRGGDILVAKIGSCGLTGIYPEDMPSAIIPANLLKITVRKDYSRKFVFHYLNSTVFSEFLKKIITATAQPAFNVTKFRMLPMPLVCKQEQDTIVAELEKQLTRLEAGVAALKRVQTNLKRCRAAVLKAACEGRLVLTEADLARKEGRTYETGEQLLARILIERRQKWQGRGKYKEPAAPDTPDLPPLSEGWTWTTVEQISILVQYGSSAKTNENPTGIPVLRMGNIEHGKLILSSLKYLPEEHTEFPELLLENGDLLFNRTNSAELVGKTAVYKGTPAICSFASYLIRIRLAEDGCKPNFLSFFVNSVFGRDWIVKVVSQQVGQANVNGTKLQNLSVPLPPLAEQTRIVAEVERRLSVIEEQEAMVAASLQRAARLRQSILERAFSGRLLS